MSWKEPYEQKFVKQFGGTLIDDLQMQYADIDVVMDDGVTYSIKHQAISERTGNMSFELKLINDRTGASMKGNYAKCEADMYAIACWKDGEEFWFIADTKEVKKFVGMGEKDWTQKPLGKYAKSSNHDRCFNQAINILVPVKEFVYHNIGKFIKVGHE